MAKKPKPKNHQPSKVYSMYTISDSSIQRKATCPKCGPGSFMANHKNRFYCGKCHFVQMK